jgi:hypothetical protein
LRLAYRLATGRYRILDPSVTGGGRFQLTDAEPETVRTLHKAGYDLTYIDTAE